jgi:type I restriction enzyme S subunit
MKISPAEWRPTKLDELGHVGRGKSRHRPRNDAILYGGPYPFFQTGDIKAANFTLTEYSQTYSEVGLAQSKLWKPGTLCITIAANIAESAILGIEGCFPDSVVGFVPDASKADVRFIKYYLEILKLGMQNVSHGSTQDNLSLDKLLSFDFLVPPLPTQRRIAGMLSAYDELIENSQRRIKILESMARALYREWFVDFCFPGYESIPRAIAPMGAIPQSWEVKKLGDICELRKDAYRDSDHAELPLIDMARMPSRTLAPGETGLPSELTTSRILFRKGDTLFGSIRCYLHKVVAAHHPGVTNTSVLVLRPNSPCFRSLLAIVASEIETIRWAETQSTGTKMPVINWGVLQNMPVPIPSSQIARKFEEIVGPMLDELGILATQNQNLRRTRDLLLPRLLSGQIDVEAMPS